MASNSVFLFVQICNIIIGFHVFTKKKEMKELDKLNIKYSERGFEVVSINIDNTRSMSKVKSYVNSQKYSFTVLSDPRAKFFRKKFKAPCTSSGNHLFSRSTCAT